MSEVAGRLSVQVGAQYLTTGHGGRGLLLGGVPGVAPAKCGASSAAGLWDECGEDGAGFGREVTLLDNNLNRLRELDDIFGGRVFTVASNAYNVGRATAEARPGDWRRAHSRGCGAEDCDTCDGREDEARCGDCGRGDRPGRVHRDGAADDAHGPVVRSQWRGALLRDEHAGGGAEHEHAGANECDVSICAAPGAGGAKAAIAADPGIAEGVNTYAGALTYHAVADAQQRAWRPVG